MFEFPERGVWGPIVKNVAHYASQMGSSMREVLTFMEPVHIQLPHEGGYVRMLEILPVAISHDLRVLALPTPKLLKTQCWGS